MATQRVLSFDVGMRHLAYADVEFSTGGAPAGAAASGGAAGGAAASGGAEAELGDGVTMTVHRWGVIDATGGAAAAKSGAVVGAVLRALDDELLHGRHALARFDHVLIENQPARKNPAMKAVQVTIHAFFEMLRINTDGLVGDVHLVSPGNKTAAAPGSAAAAAAAPASAPGAKTASASYRDRKALSVQLCRQLLERYAPQALPTLTGARKRDDLADAMMQAAWFCRARLGARPEAKARRSRAAAPP